MSVIWSQQIDSILSSGISLEYAGIKNWALRRDDALRAICELEDLGVPILGGDVYQLVGEYAEQTYDSWYCNHEVGESDLAFLKRSSDKARVYICNYLVDGALFAIVPKI
ncbi:TPA: Imm40 family immunity protein [Pseudomonas aeruginosa]|uniref:Imm40 family immunity protein n=1 Tax=Pseudomonas aeruginosa TaxID=287 RepID=UPI0008FAF87E|nr:hypothetical protein CD796_00325 [Pseudomonas aeruginosa]AZM83270.1 hypothetical protein EIP87_15045 [Pseudomonas aeruginosa]EKU8169078.1 hypothetical protein [Pseudomonas aeruginosa]KAB0709420.1 hypothetical protein F7O95_32910 [Pseudomonas aeruginosa]MBG5506499.1 hypothetical protein [Pseudomonas aeruginosa]